MIIEQKQWSKTGGWEDAGLQDVGEKAHFF